MFFDIFMPELDGIAFLERLRANPEFADLPVIAISSAQDRDLVLKLVGLKISDYLVKPLELEPTFKRLERLIPTLLQAPRPSLAPGSSPAQG